MPTIETIKARFCGRLKTIEKTGCWEWQGAFFKGKRYGIFYWGIVNGKEKMFQAHRAAWTLFRGAIPDGTIICHKCNNPPCCNPDHLYVGTHLTNARDRDDAGTTSRWDGRYNFKRSDDLLEKLKECFRAGATVAQAQKILGIGWQTIYRSRDQDPELKAIMAETKRARYSKAGKQRWADGKGGIRGETGVKVGKSS